MLSGMTRLILRSTFVAALGGVLLLTGGARLRGASQAGAAITVDFQAVSADGQPILDLKAEEVSLRVAGRPRPVKALQLVRVAGGASAGPAAGVPPPFGTNVGAGGDGRQIAIVVEDESLRTGAERQLRDAIGAFLDALGPADRVALTVAPRDTAAVGFSAGMARVREALAKIQGRADPAPSDDEEACRTRDTLAALRNQLLAMSGGETPTMLLFFSSKLTSPTAAQQARAGQCDITAQSYQAIGSAAVAARAQMYVVQQDDTVARRSEGLENLAGTTSGGQVVRLSASTSALARVLSETSAYYVATFDADPSDRGNQAQRLELRVTRAGVTTRARQEVLAASGAKPAAARMTPQQMLREARAFRDLPVRAVAYASRGAAGRMTVLVLGESADPATKITAAAVGLVDAAGKLVGQATAGEKELAAAPITIATAVAPGTYRLRFAATDASGRGGAADYEIVADLAPAGSLKLSGLLLGAIRNNAMAMALQFRDEEKIVGYLEMYGQITAKVSARMEVATSLDGPAIATIQPGGSGTTEADKFILTGEIPIAALAPGDYVVRAFVNVEGQPEGKVVKTFRKLGK
jgi:hypothetical protein